MEEPGNEDARFDALFGGLEAQAAAEAAIDDDVATEELQRAAWGEVTLLERVRAASAVVIEVSDHGLIAGDVSAVGADVVVLVADDGEWAVPAWGISAVIGLGDATAGPGGAVSSRLGLAAIARAWSRERSAVRIIRRGGAPLDGTIDRVGSDHLDVAEHDPGMPRMAAEVRRSLVVPLRAVSALRRR